MPKDMAKPADDLRGSPQGKGQKISISNPPKRQVKVLGNRPLVVAVLVAGVILAVFLYSIVERSNAVKHGEAERAKKTAVVSSKNAAEELTADWQSGLIFPAQEPVTPADIPDVLDTPPALAGMEQPVAVVAEYQEPSLMDEEIQRIRLGKLKSYHIALDSPLKIDVSDINSSPNQSSDLLTSAAAGAGNSGGLSAEQAQMLQAQAAQYDPNMQIRKESFLSADRTPIGYLPYTIQNPITPFEIKTGTIIPGVMVSGVNSDLPGQIIGQVSQNVYDSAFGRYLLIPQGAKLIGTYDSRIVMGQSRVLVAWTRIVFPNGKTLELGSMPGADGLGYAGLSDQVDNHYFRIFGQALLLSLITAGTSYAIPDDDNNSNNNNRSINDELRAAIATQMMTVGSNLIERNMNIQPTIEIRPGLRFNIMVNKDMVLYPWSL